MKSDLQRESADTLKPEEKSFRPRDSGVVAFNENDRYKLQEIEKAIDTLLMN
jgi:hypothetical protein